ncbi:MAG: aminoglycoside phosphotransferase family protein [Defluviitaleaceae bacterium]|nr:aminoglycoside phosphotransferase family protein [Defluviitaleaceae bacterium]
MMLGMEKIGQGMTTTVYRDGDTAVKVYENTPIGEVENEAARQRFAVDAGLPVPAVCGVRRIGDNAVALEMQCINGKPLMHPGMDEADLLGAVDTLVGLQRAVHKIDASGQPKQCDRFVHRIKQTHHINDAQKSQLLAKMKQLDTHAMQLCHGDFHPLNILYDGRMHWIIDWVNACAGNPLADACRTYLIFTEHIPHLAEVYLRVFCQAAEVSCDDVLVWRPIVAAARLVENMSGEKRTMLLNIINEEIPSHA